MSSLIVNKKILKLRKDRCYFCISRLGKPFTHLGHFVTISAKHSPIWMKEIQRHSSVNFIRTQIQRDLENRTAKVAAVHIIKDEEGNFDLRCPHFIEGSFMWGPETEVSFQARVTQKVYDDVRKEEKMKEKHNRILENTASKLEKLRQQGMRHHRLSSGLSSLSFEFVPVENIETKQTSSGKKEVGFGRFGTYYSEEIRNAARILFANGTSLRNISESLKLRFGLEKGPCPESIRTFIFEGGLLADAQTALDLHNLNGNLALGLDESGVRHRSLMVVSITGPCEPKKVRYRRTIDLIHLSTKGGKEEAAKTLESLQNISNQASSLDVSRAISDSVSIAAFNSFSSDHISSNNGLFKCLTADWNLKTGNAMDDENEEDAEEAKGNEEAGREENEETEERSEEAGEENEEGEKKKRKFSRVCCAMHKSNLVETHLKKGLSSARKLTVASCGETPPVDATGVDVLMFAKGGMMASTTSNPVSAIDFLFKLSRVVAPTQKGEKQNWGFEVTHYLKKTWEIDFSFLPIDGKRLHAYSQAALRNYHVLGKLKQFFEDQLESWTKTYLLESLASSEMWVELRVLGLFSMVLGWPFTLYHNMLRVKDMFEVARGMKEVLTSSTLLSDEVSFLSLWNVFRRCKSVIAFEGDNSTNRYMTRLQKAKEYFKPIRESWGEREQNLWEKVCKNALAELNKIAKEYLECHSIKDSNLLPLADYPACNLDCERFFGIVKDLDTKKKHMSVPIIRASQTFRSHFVIGGSPIVTKLMSEEDLKTIRKQARLTPPAKNLQERINQEVQNKKDKNRIEQERRKINEEEKKRKRDDEMRGEVIVFDVDLIHPMKGKSLKNQLRLHQEMGAKITLGGKVEEQRTRLLDHIKKIKASVSASSLGPALVPAPTLASLCLCSAPASAPSLALGHAPAFAPSPALALASASALVPASSPAPALAPALATLDPALAPAPSLSLAFSKLCLVRYASALASASAPVLVPASASATLALAPAPAPYLATLAPSPSPPAPSPAPSLALASTIAPVTVFLQSKLP
jgi:hypothetical protein